MFHPYLYHNLGHLLVFFWVIHVVLGFPNVNVWKQIKAGNVIRSVNLESSKVNAGAWGVCPGGEDSDGPGVGCLTGLREGWWGSNFSVVPAAVGFGSVRLRQTDTVTDHEVRTRSRPRQALHAPCFCVFSHLKRADVLRDWATRSCGGLLPSWAAVTPGKNRRAARPRITEASVRDTRGLFLIFLSHFWQDS